jgi:hypothetical protein
LEFKLKAHIGLEVDLKNSASFFRFVLQHNELVAELANQEVAHLWPEVFVPSPFLKQHKKNIIDY